MDIPWTDGTDMPFVKGGPYRTWANSLPKVTRDDLALLRLKPGESPYMWKLRDLDVGEVGEVYAKVYCGDYGYYSVIPVIQEFT